MADDKSGFFAQEKFAFTVLLLVMDAWAQSIEVLLRRDFGVRHLHPGRIVVLMGLGLWYSVAGPSLPGEASFSLFLALYCLAVLMQTCRHVALAHWREWRGTDPVYSQHQGTSWPVWYRLTGQRERLIQQGIEPALVLTLAWALGEVPALTTACYRTVGTALQTVLAGSAHTDSFLAWAAPRLLAVTGIDRKMTFWLVCCGFSLLASEWIAWRNTRERARDLRDASVMAADATEAVEAAQPNTPLAQPPYAVTRATTRPHA